ncbi:hypothetical protein [Micromonospora sp. NPDC049891]|uniref:hypothetical protein n=1 Tax=Micromonospora sp. NPDC049891 TaxID=3155655 RepID=UPI0033D8289F
MTYRHPDKPDLWANARRELRTAAAERYIHDLINTFPAPTPEQRARLAALLLPAGDGDA